MALLSSAVSWLNGVTDRSCDECRRGESASACGARLGLRHSLLYGVWIDDNGGKLCGVGVWRHMLAGRRRRGFRERRGLSVW